MDFRQRAMRAMYSWPSRYQLLRRHIGNPRRECGATTTRLRIGHLRHVPDLARAFDLRMRSEDLLDRRRSRTREAGNLDELMPQPGSKVQAMPLRTRPGSPPSRLRSRTPPHSTDARRSAFARWNAAKACAISPCPSIAFASANPSRILMAATLKREASLMLTRRVYVGRPAPTPPLRCSASFSSNGGSSGWVNRRYFVGYLLLSSLVGVSAGLRILTTAPAMARGV